MKTVEQLRRKLLKRYLKMLEAYARRKIARGYELEDRVIELELKLKERERDGR